MPRGHSAKLSRQARKLSSKQSNYQSVNFEKNLQLYCYANGIDYKDIQKAVHHGNHH